MKHLIILTSLSLILLLGACEKEVLKTTVIDKTLVEATTENNEALSLRQGYQSMHQLKEQLSKVITNKEHNKISAAWVYKENIGLIIGTKYAVINRVTGDMTSGFLKDADNKQFWLNAPHLQSILIPTDKRGNHHPLNKNNGITAGWIFNNHIGFISERAYWNTTLNEFSNSNVWDLEISKTGYLYQVDFWKDITFQLRPKGVTAGFFSPDNNFVAFSGSKIFVKDLAINKWIVTKEIADLGEYEPFAFLKTAPLQQLKEINAAFYNEGANEYVFMSEHAWAAYGITSKSWTFGSLSSCYDAQMANKTLVCPADYKPVCGCDGITYGNSCSANNNGITVYREGICN